MAALEDLPGFSEQCPHALLAAQRGPFFNPCRGAFRGSLERCEDSSILAKVHCIIAPQAGCDHATVEIEDLQQLWPFEADLLDRTRVREWDDGAGRPGIRAGHAQLRFLLPTVVGVGAGEVSSPPV